ncbi:MAG: NAD(+)/NADH kinase [Phycisphaeraceae bacterium]|nr:NAD(+)/NADH kinase [Phycisphaeraceae bacterium]
MKVAVVINERSGRGHARRLGLAAADALRLAGHKPVVTPVGPKSDTTSLAAAVDSCSHAVVVGGDGTVNHLLDLIKAAGIPLYHLPTGNENLLAREFGMNASVPRLLAALHRNLVLRVDLGMCNGRAFSLMASIGPDAGVIHRVHASRTRANGHVAYIKPVLDELIRPHLPRLTVTVDGESIAHGQRGFVVVANSRHYGLRIDPCPRANVADGLLDAAFFPASSAAVALGWMLAARCRLLLQHPSCLRASGRVIEVRSQDADAPCQIDGEIGPVGDLTETPGQALWRCTAEPQAVSILVPE